MIQCFVKKEFSSVFEKGTKPRLISASKIDSFYTIHPRMLHCHQDQLEILYVRSGSGIYIIEENRYSIKTGDIIICNRGVLHDEDPEHSQNLNTYCLTVTDVHIKGLPENCLIREEEYPLIASHELGGLLEHMMETVYSLLAAGMDGVEESCSYFSCGIISLVYQIACKSRIEGGQIHTRASLLSRQIKHYIDTHYDEDLTLNSIGEVFHMNPYYISHVFKNNIGYSPIQYIMRRRIGEAQNLLIYTDYSITMISSMVGYNNPSHFNSMFTKYVNISPSEYRKNYTNKKKKKK